MKITLELPADLAARFAAQAEATGVPVAEIITVLLYRASPPNEPAQLTAEEIDRAFEEAADLIPRDIRPLSDEAMSRDSIYTREDDWNNP